MKIKHLSELLPTLYLVSLVVVMLISVEMKPILAQSTEEDEIEVTVRPISPITTDLTPNEFKFGTNLRISRVYFNPENANCLLTISEGTLLWLQSYSNLTIFDNLGNNFEPVVRNDSVMNPSAQVVLPPFFEYKISLSVDTDIGIYFDGQNNTYCLDVDFKPPIPTVLHVRFPNNYTILQFNSGAVQEQTDEFITLEWNMQQNQAFSLRVRFLPFCLQVTVKSYTFTFDFPTVFPIRGFIRCTWKEVFETPATFSIWEIDPFFSISMPFPSKAQNVTVEKVCDGMGACKEISRSIVRPDNGSLGHYFVDNENRKAIVYPRHHYKNDFYEYILEATFVLPNIRHEKSLTEAIKWFLLPFRCEFIGGISEFSLPANYKLDITGNVEARFILPPGAEPLVSESGNPIIGVEEDRPVARFVYYSPKTLSPTEWKVVCDITSLKNFFYIEIASFITLLVIAVVIARAQNLPSGLILGFIPVSFSVILFNASSFLSLGGSKSFLILLFIGEIILFLAIVTVSIKKLRKKQISKKVLIRWLHFERTKTS